MFELEKPSLFELAFQLAGSIAMSLKYSEYLDYTYIYKSLYLLIIVGFAGIVYFISCYLLGLLKTKNYRTN